MSIELGDSRSTIAATLFCLSSIMLLLNKEFVGSRFEALGGSESVGPAMPKHTRLRVCGRPISVS